MGVRTEVLRLRVPLTPQAAADRKASRVPHLTGQPLLVLRRIHRLGVDGR